MTHYIDGFTLPIPRTHLDAYQKVAKDVARIWKEHGALDYREYVGDDMQTEGTGSFTGMLTAKDNEVIIFGWVAFASREARDLANERVASDPRMTTLIDAEQIGFDAQRMAYGGFRPLLVD
ncbi:DUF1428 domain-containing protein [Marinicella sp. W31]|uniref:DUF1428 domain-containing protein n=1 Tax=Marinicella sp. W31 TaxID=3023713 RepID=UPI003757FC61